MYTPRTLEPWFRQASRQFPVMLVTGARQVGKTTFLQHLREKSRAYVTLDDPLVWRLAKEDPALFMQRFPPPVLIDEIQYAPELLPYLKMEVDRDRKPGRFWLTGSQQFHLMRGISESLAGRVGIVQLLGLSRQEATGRARESKPFLPRPKDVADRAASAKPLKLKPLFRAIWRGSFPEMALKDQTDRDLFYNSYVQTYLQRDIRDLARVGDELAFLRFLRAAAARSGRMLNMAELARDADVAPNTAKHWLSILRASGVVYLLEPYHTNVTKRLLKTPKLYFLDTGLCAYLTEWSSPETLEAGAASGAIFETWVVGELLKSWWHAGRSAPFYFARDKDGREIDLLIVQDGKAYPIEIKKTASPGPEDVRHFALVENLGLPLASGGLVCLAEQSLPMGKNVVSIPVGVV
jgi:hypothetical protein